MEIQQDTIENEYNSHIFLIVKTCIVDCLVN
jgi:hypothetical protein